MSPDRTSLVTFDPERGEVVHRAELRRPELLWGRQLNAIDWSTEGRSAPTVHHTVHQGFRPEGVTQEMLALYGDRVDRTLLPPDETAPLVVTTAHPDLEVVTAHELAMDDFDRSRPRAGGRAQVRPPHPGAPTSTRPHGWIRWRSRRGSRARRGPGGRPARRPGRCGPAGHR